jgi:hypothetical protein
VSRTRHPPPEEPGFNACELQVSLPPGVNHYLLRVPKFSPYWGGSRSLFSSCAQELEAAMIEDELRAQGFSDEDIKNMEAMAAQEAREQQQHAGRGRGRGRGRGVGRW